MSLTDNEEKTCGCGNECDCSGNNESRDSLNQQEGSNYSEPSGCGCGSDCGCH